MPFRIPPSTPALSVTFNDVHQTMDGFGASDRNSVDLDSTLADLFFSQSAGIGLSFLRTTMYEDGTGTTPTNLTLAVARGAKVWMAPWTAAAVQKDNGSLNNGGHLLSAQYNAWATTMAAFQAACGVNIYAVSVQNEPDFSDPFPTMLYTTAEIVAFVKVLGPKLAALTPRPKLMLPEVSNASLMGSYVSAILADGTAAPYLDIVAWHQYAGNNTSPIVGYPNWQSEMSYFDAFDPTMTSALTMSGDIHAALTTGNVSAWHYWELTAPQSDNEGLIGHDGGTQTTKRVYALGNWSKFVRPGMVRCGIIGAVSGVSATAFKDSGSGAMAVVAVNANASPQSFSIALGGLTVSTVTPWITDATRDLAAQSAIAVNRSGAFTCVLPASSVTTFAGTGS